MWGNLADAYRWLPGCEAQATTAYDQAISLMHEQLEINPNAAKPWCELAVWLAKRGKAREALPAVRRGLRLDSGDVNNMALAVTVYHLVGDRDRALGWLEKAVGQGYDRVELERDPELAALRFDPEFKRILDGREAR